jgi:hypothetical protein
MTLGLRVLIYFLCFEIEVVFGTRIAKTTRKFKWLCFKSANTGPDHNSILVVQVQY